MKILAIVFDFDGVLVESVDIKGAAFVELYRDEEQTIQDQVLAFHEKNGGMSRFEKIKYYEEKLLNRACNQDIIGKKAEQFSKIVEDKVVECPFVSGALEFLKNYHQKFPLYVASATPQEELIRIIKRRKIDIYFRKVFGTPVKKQDHIFNILKENNWNPENLVMIGDAMADYTAAQINNVPFLGRVMRHHQTPFPDGTKIIEDLVDLPETLGILS